MNTALPALVNGGILSVPIAAAVWLLLRLSRRGLNAATRYGIWWAALFVSMALPALFLPIKFPSVNPRLKPKQAQERVEENPAPLAPRSASPETERDKIAEGAPIAQSTQPVPDSRAFPSQDQRQSALAAVTTKPSIFASLPIPIRLPSSAWSTRAAKLLAELWALASLLLFVRLAASFAILWLRKNRADEAPSHVQESMARCLAACGVRRQARIAVVKTGDSPMVAGPFRPSVLIPARLLSALDDAELEQICLHEAAHLARYDDWSLLLQRTAEAVFVFHPVVRWIARQIDLEREIACDDFVISATGQPRPYAACLTHVAELAAGHSTLPLAAAVVDESSHLTRRVSTLLDKSRRTSTRILRFQLAAAVLALSLLTWLAGRSPALFAMAQPQSAPPSAFAASAPQIPIPPAAPIPPPPLPPPPNNAGALGSALVSRFPLYLETNMRPVQGIVPGQQNYLVLDEQIWAHARRDLGDLRLFAGDQEVPYALTTLQGSTSGQRAEVKLLNLGLVNGETQFDIDMQGNVEYDQVTLRLDGSASNFVARASVEGFNDLPVPKAVTAGLGTSVLFDLSNEGLGSDFTLKFSTSRFRYLRVRVPQIKPEQVLGAVAIDTHLYPALRTPVSAALPVEQTGGTTVVTWDASEQVPVSRVVLDVDPSQTNFWRDIEVLTPSGGTVTNTSVRRVHLARGGDVAEAESLAIELPYEAWGGFKIVIENGDGPPLKITSAKGYFYERRLYFDPKTSADVGLYYGSPRIAAPSYPYAKNFQPQESVAIASLGLDMQNPAYTAYQALLASRAAQPLPPQPCSTRDYAANLLSSDPAYPDTMALARTLNGSGLVVNCILPSVHQGLFGSQMSAALYRTDQGDFELWLLPKPQTFALFEVTEQQQNGRYLYSLRGVGDRSPRMDSTKPMEFVKHGNQLFVVWGNKQLAAMLHTLLDAH